MLTRIAQRLIEKALVVFTMCERNTDLTDREAFIVIRDECMTQLREECLRGHYPPSMVCDIACRIGDELDRMFPEVAFQ